jgi:hypothetical protein
MKQIYVIPPAPNVPKTPSLPLLMIRYLFNGDLWTAGVGNVEYHKRLTAVIGKTDQGSDHEQFQENIMTLIRRNQSQHKNQSIFQSEIRTSASSTSDMLVFHS